MTFEKWYQRCSRIRVPRLWRSAKWRLWSQWPIVAMRVGWDARRAVERMESRNKPSWRNVQ